MATMNFWAFLLEGIAPRTPYATTVHRTRVVKLPHTWVWYCRECPKCSPGGNRRDSWVYAMLQADRHARGDDRG